MKFQDSSGNFIRFGDVEDKKIYKGQKVKIEFDNTGNAKAYDME